MRIIAGEFRGRKMMCPQTLLIRPTSDRVRESLFNILGGICQEAWVLDLFAGVGTFGFEAISRGARQATFVENSPVSLKFLRKNGLFCRDRMDVIPGDVGKVLRVLSKQRKRFDLIFLDPPYDLGWVEKTLKKLDEEMLTTPEGMIIVQHSKREIFSRIWKNFQMCDERKYGDTGISFFRSQSWKIN